MTDTPLSALVAALWEKAEKANDPDVLVAWPETLDGSFDPADALRLCAAVEAGAKLYNAQRLRERRIHAAATDRSAAYEALYTQEERAWAEALAAWDAAERRGEDDLRSET